MIRPDDGLYAALVRRGMSRRAFLKFSTAMAAALALPATYAPRIAAAVEGAPRLPVIWLRGQSCGGNTEALLAATRPTVAELLLALVSRRVPRVADDLLGRGRGGRPGRQRCSGTRTGISPWSRARSRRRTTGWPARSAAAPSGTWCATSATAPSPRSPSARARLTAVPLAPAAVHTGAVGIGEVAGEARLINLPGCPSTSRT